MMLAICCSFNAKNARQNTPIAAPQNAVNSPNCQRKNSLSCVKPKNLMEHGLAKGGIKHIIRWMDC
jgi:hypothetical protein